MIRVGTAGWTVPRQFAEHFPAEGSGLLRYATVFSAVEINSTFYRPHRETTFRRWAETVPEPFRFAVKAPRAITHDRRLVDCAGLLATFLAEISALGDKLGPLLVQLPPSFAFDPSIAAGFLAELRQQFAGAVACEPRHPTWFSPEADDLLNEFRVARVAADPACVPAAAEPGGWRHLLYIRLHGSPHMYRSSYGAEAVAAIAVTLTASAAPERWCIFDNTTLGAAAGNALALQDLTRPGP